MNEKQIIYILNKTGLLEHPRVVPEITYAKRTGDWSRLSVMLTQLAPRLEQATKFMEYQQYAASADPYFPRPFDDEFSGNIPIAPILEPITGTPQSIFTINTQDLVRHTSIFGATGTGKTNAEKCIISSILQSVPNARFWIFDPQKIYRNAFHPYFVTLGFDDFVDETFDKPTNKINNRVWYDRAIQMLGTEQYFQTGSKYSLQNIIEHIEKKPRHRFPRHKDILQVTKAFEKNTRTFKEKDTYNTLINRFSGIVNFENRSRQASIPICDLMQQNIIFEWGDEINEIKIFRTALLITKLYMLKKYESQDIINIIVIDEARSIFGNRADGWGESLLEETFTRSRHMNIGFMVITQEPSSISKVVKSNSNTIIAFPVSDIEKLSIQRGMLLNAEQFAYYDRELPATGKGSAIVRYANINRPFPVQFPLYPDNAQMPSEDEITTLKENFLTPYEMPKETPVQPTPDTIEIPPDALLIIKTLIDKPFLNSRELYNECDLQVAPGTKAKQWLFDNEFAVEKSVRVKAKGPAPKFTVLTSKAYKHLKIKQPSWGKKSFEHRLYQQLVAVTMRKKGWSATIEKRTTNPQSQHTMDVFCQKDGKGIDFEITIHRENLGENIVKGIRDDDVDEVVVVTPNKKAEELCRKEVQDKIKQFGKRLRFETIDKFYLTKGTSSSFAPLKRGEFTNGLG